MFANKLRCQVFKWREQFSHTVFAPGFDKELAASFAQPTSAIDNLGDVVRRFDAGEYDLVALGRALLMDPAWVLKALANVPFEPFDITAYGRLD